MAKSTGKSAKGKPKKPTKDFPLFPHAVGLWAKKVRGKLHYFGPWADPQAALNRWLDEKDALLAGRKPRAKTGELTVKGLADRFLTAKHNRVQSGELTARSLQDYTEICQRVADVFGKDRAVADLAADDFGNLRKAFSTTHGPNRLVKDITVAKMLFRWGHESGLCNLPLFGPEFKPPSRKSKAKAGRASGRKDFDADEIRRLLGNASPRLHAMILLGINGGLGQSDIAELRTSNVDLEFGWLNFPRPKTEVERRIPLWPETLQALRGALETRREAKHPADADRVFLTPAGRCCVRTTATSRTDIIGAEFNRLMDSLGINGRRGFYGLRHSFRTVADTSKDQPACDCVMGHTPQGMSANYRHGVDDQRLRDVANVVRAWLWPAAAEGGAE